MSDIQEYFPDPNRATTGDMFTRNLYFRSHLYIDIETTEATVIAEILGRIRSVEVGAVSGGTVTIQVQVDGSDIFDDATRPISGVGVATPTYIYNFSAPTAITAIIEDSTGAPTGTTPVVIEVEPYTLAPRSPQIEPHGADRKRPSTRAAIKQFNATGSLVPAIVTQRVVGKSIPLVLPIGEPLGYRPREVI